MRGIRARVRGMFARGKGVLTGLFEQTATQVKSAEDDAPQPTTGSVDRFLRTSATWLRMEQNIGFKSLHGERNQALWVTRSDKRTMSSVERFVSSPPVWSLH